MSEQPFQVGDRVVTNEFATEHVRGEVMMDGVGCEEKSIHFTAGEKAVVREVYPAWDVIAITFVDGVEDCVDAYTLDLEYRPINDPSMYDKTLFD